MFVGGLCGGMALGKARVARLGASCFQNRAAQLRASHQPRCLASAGGNSPATMRAMSCCHAFDEPRMCTTSGNSCVASRRVPAGLRIRRRAGRQRQQGRGTNLRDVFVAAALDRAWRATRLSGFVVDHRRGARPCWTPSMRPLVLRPAFRRNQPRYALSMPAEHCALCF